MPKEELKIKILFFAKNELSTNCKENVKSKGFAFLRISGIMIKLSLPQRASADL